MSITTDDDNTVELASTERVERLIGIVGNNALVEFGGAAENIRIVTSGVALGLVSDANGTINPGDKITASPIEGVGMKATQSVQIVGTAQSSLSTAAAQPRTVTNENGEQVTVHIALLPLQVGVTSYTPPENRTSFLPAFIQDFANSISGHEVSPVRVIISSLILIMAFAIIAVLLSSTVRSSIISIGRNPLSEKAVRKSIIQIGITVVGILLITLITIYLILTT